jgi:peptidoglycan hydrolase-like protein with peptidoglycan-binding domain
MSFPTLKKGSNSESVGDWQAFLRGQNLYFGAVDNDFGAGTEKATIAFQTKYALTPDGEVGKKTCEKAVLLGFHIEVSASPSLTAKPKFPPLTGNASRERLFGKFEYHASPTADNPERIVITDDWAKKNIVKVSLPALSKATGGKYTSMYWHKSADEQLVKFFEELEKQNLHTKILSFAGSYVPRFIRGSRSQLSNHSWGTAFDINVPYNGLNKTPAQIGQKGCVRELVPIAHEFGFYWGGNFSRPDGMHFEIAVVQNW